MSERYIKGHFEDIKKFANTIEKRLEDDCTLGQVLEDNAMMLESARKQGVNYILIDEAYEIKID